MYKQICALTSGFQGELIKIRRKIHARPELGREEYETSRLLQKQMTDNGPFEITHVGPTGFYADLVSGSGKPWMAIRGDMDALPITDEKQVNYRSQISGVCHACAHDFHSTVVLGTAWVLSKFVDNLNCNIRFIFQHAEEPTPGGAIDFVDAGALNNVQAIFGLHADPMLEVGQIGIRPGPISAQSVHLKINIKGEGGHSARPQKTADPIFAGISILHALYGSLYRMYNPDTPFVFTIGSISGGDSYNSISAGFKAEGTLRVTDLGQRDHILKFIEDTVNHTLSQWDLEGGFEINLGAPPVDNDVELTKRTIDVLSQILSEDQILSHARSMGGEDFSQYQTRIPGVFIKTGVGTKQKLHTGLFDIDEKSIGFSVPVLAWLLLKLEPAGSPDV